MTRALIIIACLVVILAGLKAAATLAVPFLLAAFLGIILAPPFAYMKQKGIPGAQVVFIVSEDGETAFAAICFAVG